MAIEPDFPVLTTSDLDAQPLIDTHPANDAVPTSDELGYSLRNVGELQTAIDLSLGAASACWATLEGAGEFNSDRAKLIGDELAAWIATHWMPRDDRSEVPVENVD